MRASTHVACAWIAVTLVLACSTQPSANPVPSPDAQAREDASSGDAGAAPGDAAEPMFDAEVPRPLPTRDGVAHCQLLGTRSEDLARVELAKLEGPVFDQAIGLTARTDEPEVIYVIERSGRLQRVDLSSQPFTVRTVLDVSERFACCAQGGLIGVTFHPGFDSNGLIFVHYVTGASSRSVIASLHVDPASGEAELGSERIVLEVKHPGEGRNGGPLLFDASGMLLVALGDGGADPLSLDPNDPLLGAILRLDPSTDGTGTRYRVPDDNPFASSTDPDDPPPEVWAYGFADPSACHIDPEDQQLWCTDRGESYSELDAVEVGRDHGWPEVDGPICVRTRELCLNEPSTAAIASYPRFDAQCGALGGVPLSEPSILTGAIAYVDACSGDIFGLGVRGDNDQKRSALGSAGGPISAAGLGPDGALWVVDMQGVLARAELTAEGVPGTFPDQLSKTGCFEGPSLREPAADLIPFEVRSPLWSDGTHKRRFMVIPRGAHIEAPDEGPWVFPLGTILVKEFALQRDDQDPSSAVPIETRFMLRRLEGWAFHSYRWNEEGTDALRVQRDVEVDFEVERGGERRSQRYQFPGKETCPICHSAAPGRPLGPRTEQLNSELLYVSGMRNQLEVLSGLGLFVSAEGSSLPAEGSFWPALAREGTTLPRLPDPRDSSVPIEQRARSYLHTNCAHCHQPGGWSSPDLTMDLRYSLTLAQTHTCDEAPGFFRAAPKLIAPGDPESSVIWVRTRATDLGRMPPVATTEVDPLGTAILTEWIDSLTACPTP